MYYFISSSGALVPGLLPWAKPPSGLWQDDCCVPGWGGLRWGLRSGHGSPALCPMEPSRQLRHLHGQRGDPAAPPHPTGEAQSGHVSRWEDGERAHCGPPHRLLQDTWWDRLWKLFPCQARHPRSDERYVSEKTLNWILSNWYIFFDFEKFSSQGGYNTDRFILEQLTDTVELYDSSFMI